MPLLTLPHVWPPRGGLLLAIGGSTVDESYVRSDLTGSWRVGALVRSDLTGSWRVQELLYFPLTGSWRVLENTYVRSDLTGSWAVTRRVDCGWRGEWTVRRLYTGYLVASDIRGAWRVLGAPGVVARNLTGSWRVGALVESGISGSWRVIEDRFVRSDVAGSWRVGALVESGISGSWTVERRVADVALLASFNGINLNNGTTTHVLADGGDVGSDALAYDEIGHYDRSLRIHDVRDGLTTLTIPIFAEFGDATSLGAFLAGLRTACKAGGSLAWQASAAAPLRSFMIVPSSPPKITEDNRFILNHEVEFELVLTRWSE